MAKHANLSAEQEQEFGRPLANFSPSLWGSTFTSFSYFDLEFQSLTKEAELLKEKVKHMLIESTEEVCQNIEFINLLCRLGISYHFKTEIEQQLNQIFAFLHVLLDYNDYNLYMSALLFQILRQHGYKMSCDVFKKFKNSKGEFKKSIASDVKGILKLYEASFLSVRGEDVLDEAYSFARKQLEIFLLKKSNSPLEKHIRNALFLPFHQNVNRVQVQQFIFLYEEEEFPNEILLNFAKLDFNRLQLLYKQELALLSRWWNELDLVEKYPYARDRIVECYFWALGAHFEPEFALSRLLTAKYTALVTVVDDTYDSYAKIDELKHFTAAMESGAVDAIDQLPEYMKVLYKAILDLYNETENVGNQQMSIRTSFVKEKLIELVRCDFLEKRWFVDGYIPTLDEYLQNSIVTISIGVFPLSSFLGMENIAEIEEYQWLRNNSKINYYMNLLCRLKDDIQDEKDSGENVSCIKCYMKERGVCQKEAIEELQKMSEIAWKDINEEFMKSTNYISRTLLNVYLNFSRTICFLFRHDDSFTNPQNMKHKIASLFLQKFNV